mmetsp:Transcript_6699/g.5829  ORF Transcript_6699/g.5829 Transcript_6699/m.5829 type:complete len:118 (+) Transcript_6699:415-768(+)
MLSPIYRQQPLDLNEKNRNCLSPRVIKEGIITQNYKKENSEMKFNLNYEYIDPSIKFAQALESQKVKNTRSCIKFQNKINKLLDKCDVLQQKGEYPLVSENNLETLKKGIQVNQENY